MKKLTSKQKITPKQTPNFLGWFNYLPNWLQNILRSKVFLIIVGLIIAVNILWAFGGFINGLLFQPVKDPIYGVSFSTKQARNLSLDPRANLTALLDDMGIKHFRLMSYWDEIEPQRGQLDFSELDWQMNEVARYGGQVSLSIGLRQPRWPECHQPAWSYELKGNAWKQALYAYMELVVKRYESHPALASWQLENEALNQWFGECEPPDVQRLNEEFDLVKSWSKKPVWMSLSDQHGFPINKPVPDSFGFSVYRIVWNEKIPPTNNYLTYPTPVWYHRLRAAIIRAYSGKSIFVHELQLEPWGPVDTKYLSIAEQDKSMSLEQISKSIRFARQIGVQEIYTWGGEWWYWRKIHGDPTVWNTVKHEFTAQR